MSLLRGRTLTSTGIVYLVLLLAVVVGAILTSTADRNFFSQGNISSILTGTSILGFIAIGQTLVILIGSLDLSVPFVASLVSVLAAERMAGDPANVPSAVAVALLVAVVVGLANGLIVSVLGVHGFVATLGTGPIWLAPISRNERGAEPVLPW